MVKLLPNNLLTTGNEVAIAINTDVRKKINDPMNIQNSREEVRSSVTMWGICLYRNEKSAKAGIRNMNKKASSWKFIPRSVNAWTEVSPSTPLRVRNVE